MALTWTTGAVARETGMSRRTITRYAAAGKIPAARTLGGRLRIKPEDVQKVMLQPVGTGKGEGDDSGAA